MRLLLLLLALSLPLLLLLRVCVCRVVVYCSGIFLWERVLHVEITGWAVCITALLLRLLLLLLSWLLLCLPLRLLLPLWPVHEALTVACPLDMLLGLCGLLCGLWLLLLLGLLPGLLLLWLPLLLGLSLWLSLWLLRLSLWLLGCTSVTGPLFGSLFDRFACAGLVGLWLLLFADSR